MTAYAIIPARGGSKRCPRKNVRPFMGLPMLVHSIVRARESMLFGENIYVSTDDEEIAAVAIRAGVRVILREDPGLDLVGTQEIGRHAIMAIPDTIAANDVVCVLYATVPMLLVQDLFVGHRMLQLPSTRFAMAVGTEPLRDAGMFYFGDALAFADRVPLITSFTRMVPIPEARICDINTEDDWKMAERMYLENLPRARCAAS